MQHRAPRAGGPGLHETWTAGPVRITGAYPPPVPDVDLPTAARPRVTRYDRSRHRAPRAASRSARGWATASACLVAAGLGALFLLPQDASGPVRLDVPVAAIAAPVTTSPDGDPASTPAPALQLAASQPVRVQIPALRVTSAVMELGLEADGAMEVPPGAYPVGWYDGSPTPGQLGPAVLAGHVDWDGEPGAFYGLRELLPGDEVVVDRTDGTTATFRVDRVEEHGKEDFPTDEVYGDIDHAGLRLITCGGSFDEETGDYLDNVIVFASLATPS